MEYKTLNNGIKMPILGIGVYEIPDIDLFGFTLSEDDLLEIKRLDTGRNVTGWPSDALKYNPDLL